MSKKRVAKPVRAWATCHCDAGELDNRAFPTKRDVPECSIGGKCCKAIPVLIVDPRFYIVRPKPQAKRRRKGKVGK